MQSVWSFLVGLVFTIAFILTAPLHFFLPQHSAPAPITTSSTTHVLWTPLAQATTSIYQVRNGRVVAFATAPSGGVILTDADPNTFVVGGAFGKDSTHVYFGQFEIPGADAPTFTPVFNLVGDTSFEYEEDKHFVYADYPIPIDSPNPRGPEIQPIPGADISTFVVVIPPKSCGSNCLFDAYDAKHQYYKGLIVR